MNRRKKACHNCKYFRPYYRESFVTYRQTEYGVCKLHKKVVFYGEVCDKREKTVPKFCNITLEKIDKATDDVNYLLSVIDDKVY